MGLRGVLLVSALITLAFASTGADSRAVAGEKLRAAREFQSDLALRVWAVVPSESLVDDSDECVAGELLEVGETPAAEPLSIPRCRTWFVEPLDRRLSSAKLAKLRAVLDAQAVPGISFDGRAAIRDGALRAFEGAQSLEYLDVSGTGVSGTALRRFPRLRFLAVRNTQVMGASWLASLRGLEALDARNSLSMFDPNLESLSRAKRLRVLKLTGCFMLGIPKVKALKPLGALRRLELGDCGDARNSSLDDVAALRNLEHLDLRSTAVDDAALEQIAKLRGLRVLVLGRCRSVGDAGVARLRKHTALRALDVSGTAVTDACLDDVARLSDLQRLDLSDTDVGDEGVAKLVGLKDLVELDVSETLVSAGGLRRLREAFGNIDIRH